MIRLIIVEDETVIRNGLTKHVPWEKLGVDEMRSASNAREALDICRTYRPDIIVSDIRMPGMDGIALCEKLKEEFPESEILFVTGYEDKEYLKAAINLHAVRYIEKPIKIPDLSEAVGEAVSRVKVTRKQKTTYLHSLLLNVSVAPFCTYGSKIFRIGILRLKSASKIFDMEKILGEYLEKSDIFFLAEVFDANTLVFLCGVKHKKFSWEPLGREIALLGERHLGEKEWFLTFGSIVDGLEKVSESYREAIYTQNAVTFMGWKKVVFPGDLKEGNHDIELNQSMVDQFADALAEKNKGKAIGILNELYEMLEKNQVFMNSDVRYIYYSLKQTLAWADQSFHPGDVGRVIEGLNMEFYDNAWTFEEMHRYLLEYLEQLFAEGEERNSTYVVKKVMDYILENHGDCNLTIKVLADYVCLTPTYLSNLFKKNAGMTIGQYLVDVRVEHAKRLMKNPQLKFYQVSNIVGYNDANYFAKIFKRKTGLTPSEYKENIRTK